VNKDELILSLKTNIDKLKSLYEQVKHENQVLLNEKKSIEEKLQNNVSKNDELEQKYSSLKVAKAVLSTNTEDVSEAKQRINILVREIDKCIALLNK